MTEWRNEVEITITAFLNVADLAGDPIARSDILVEYLTAPHRPPTRLPTDTMAVYGFWGDGEWLKIGRVGPKSHARYTSQHYNPVSSRSNLSRSLVNDPYMLDVDGFDPLMPGVWIKSATHRVNILLPASRHPALLALLEAFLHLRLRPRYEG